MRWCTDLRRSEYGFARMGVLGMELRERLCTKFFDRKVDQMVKFDLEGI